MHAWYHAPLAEIADAACVAKHLYALTVFDSIVVMEKRLKNAPVAMARGYAAHAGVPPAMTFLDMRRICGVADTGDESYDG
jgi:hypothetical protein